MVDQHTIEAVLAGDQDAWDVVVKHFGPLVWSVVRAHGLSAADASDVVQGTWLRLVESLPGIRDPERISSWLCTTARREAALLLRRTRGEQLTAEPVEPADPVGAGHSADPVLAVLTADEGRRLWRAVESMDEPCRSLFRLMAAAPDAGVHQLAGRLGMPTGSYGPTRRRCLDRLRSLLVPQEAAS
ncbi:sigma-70 family RNA polymerase sigma factor [Planomonospora sp. ID91781]|uniref:ECF subfamily RNA polymerase sigma-24 subunit n=3 Tax=Planomonospora TaxID=1998 RepID=A0A171DFR5_9ACTN|nr:MULTISPECIES: sigma-70 family RNA polymerase sigma factor [Planomonospora]MBG0824635.1 sigma-70 family RNA polymerase sigma factor [Planomonospora sp. ID91781]GAT68270.1 ECF subfamily RNA polymerase sigma-24 subunit [Planomonospora sphaerica]GGK63916.1 RNA polymerase sigma factor [Planomonospora parontospora]GII08154.1 RNA polymerase sigma factor [Planomonospora parontospora subsp. parontospora]